VAGVVRLRRRGEHWPVHRTVMFCLLGLGGFAFTTMSFLGTYQQVLFWPRAVQIITLLMVVPLFLALGAPVRLAVDAGTPVLSRSITRVLGSRIARLLTFPAVVSGVFLTTPFLIYFSPIYEATLRSRGSAWLLNIGIVGVGFYYYWTRLRLDPVPKEYPHLVSVWITFAEAIADGALGLTLMLGHNLVAGDYYQALARTWGPSPKQDQVWGGGALWLIGDLAGVPFIGALWRRMFHEDQQKAAEIDEELDALDAAAAAAAAAGNGSVAGSGSGSDSDSGSGSGSGSGEEGLEPGRTRPWWESDPVLGARYGYQQPE
jgi:cytochrome c oxidase assembly factor CtaG